MRVTQPVGLKGSLKWIQRAVAEKWPELEDPIRARLGSGNSVEWLSPRQDDHWAEYRDSAFLRLLGLDEITPRLSGFWPKQGPQWDALGRIDSGEILLVEAKSHIGEFCTPKSGARSASSKALIGASLTRVAESLGSSEGARWPTLFYQYANRLAHLWFLRDCGVNAYLVIVGFVADDEMFGPANVETWDAAYRIADYALGLNGRHPLTRFIIHACPRVRS